MRLLLFFCFCLIGFLKPVLASSITPEMQAEDARLQQRVRIVAYRFYTGEYCESLTRLTGVEVVTDSKNGSSDDRFSAVFLDIPLADAMNAVRSLFSYRGATYAWVRERTPNGAGKTQYRYRLLRSKNLQNYALSLRNAVQADFEADVFEQIATVSNAKAQPTTASATAMKALGSSLPPEDIRKALRGEDFRFPAENLNEAMRAYIETQKPKEDPTRKLPPGVSIAPWEEPTAVVIASRHDQEDIAPHLFLFLETVGEMDGLKAVSKTGGGMAGGLSLENKWRQKLGQDWRLSSLENKPSNRARTKPTPSPISKEEQKVLNEASETFQWLYKFARQSGQSVVARLPYYSARSPRGSTPETTADLLKQLPPLQLDHKWVGDVLAITDHSLAVNSREETRIPWEVVKRFRNRVANEPTRTLSLEDFLFASVRLTEAQLEEMSRYDQWLYDQWDDMRVVKQFLPLLRAFQADRRLLVTARSKSGILVAALPRPVQAWVREQAKAGDFLFLKPEKSVQWQSEYIRVGVGMSPDTLVWQSEIFSRPWPSEEPELRAFPVPDL